MKLKVFGIGNGEERMGSKIAIWDWGVAGRRDTKMMFEMGGGNSEVALDHLVCLPG